MDKRKITKTSKSTRSGMNITTTKTKTYSKPKKSGVKSVSKTKTSSIGFKVKPPKAKTNYKSTRSKKGRAKK